MDGPNAKLYSPFAVFVPHRLCQSCMSIRLVSKTYEHEKETRNMSCSVKVANPVIN